MLTRLVGPIFLLEANTVMNIAHAWHNVAVSYLIGLSNQVRSLMIQVELDNKDGLFILLDTCIHSRL